MHRVGQSLKRKDVTVLAGELSCHSCQCHSTMENTCTVVVKQASNQFIQEDMVHLGTCTIVTST